MYELLRSRGVSQQKNVIVRHARLIPKRVTLPCLLNANVLHETLIKSRMKEIAAERIFLLWYQCTPRMSNAANVR